MIRMFIGCGDITKSMSAALLKKYVKVTFTRITEMIKEHGTIDPNIMIPLLKNYM